MRPIQTHNWKPEIKFNSIAMKLNKFHPLSIHRQVHTVFWQKLPQNGKADM